MSDKTPHQICVVDPKQGTATTLTADRDGRYNEAFRSEPLIKDRFIPKPLLSAFDQLFGTSLAKPQALTFGVKGNYSADAEVYIPRHHEYVAAPDIKLGVAIDGWEAGGQPQGSCILEAGNQSKTMPIAIDRRTPAEKDPSLPATLSPRLTM